MQDVIGKHLRRRDVLRSEAFPHTPLQPRHEIQQAHRPVSLQASILPPTVDVLLYTRVQFHCRLVLRTLQAIDGALFATLFVAPPPCHNRADVHRRQIQPPTEHLLLHAESAVWLSSFSLWQHLVVWTHKVHIEASSDEVPRLLCIHRRSQTFTPGQFRSFGFAEHDALGNLRCEGNFQFRFHGIQFSFYAFPFETLRAKRTFDSDHVESSWVIILMHRFLLRPSDAPRTVTVLRKRTQSVQKPSHHPPSHLQTFERVPTSTNITSQHHVQRHILRMVRHD